MNLDNVIIDGDFVSILMWFAIYCVLGWIWESTLRTVMEHKIVNSGFLVGPYIPIYGFGALGYILIMHFTMRPIELFFIGGILACALEYVTSWALEKLFHARWWDYSNAILNINGRICLKGFLAFGAFAVILPYIQLAIGQFASSIVDPWRWIIVIVFYGIFITDLVHTVNGLIKFNKTLRRFQKEIERQTAPLTEIANQGRNRFEVYIRQGQHKIKEIITSTEIRIMRVFPQYRSIAYPEAFKRIRKAYNDSLKSMKDNRYKPTKPKKKTKQ